MAKLRVYREQKGTARCRTQTRHFVFYVLRVAARGGALVRVRPSGGRERWNAGSSRWALPGNRRGSTRFPGCCGPLLPLTHTPGPQHVSRRLGAFLVRPDHALTAAHISKQFGKVSCHIISTGFLTDCTSQTHRQEYVLTPPSVSTDACAPCHRFKSFAAPSVFYRGVRDECQISTGGVS